MMRAGTAPQPMAATQPIPIDLKRSVLMSGGELQHYYRLASLDDSQASEAAMRRSALHAQSQSRYKNWNNTLEAQRLAKKSDRARKLEAVERRAQQLDAEEAMYQEEARRVVLDRANKLLWQDTDKVKQFQGGMLHAAVIKERESQIALAARKKAQRYLIDQSFHDVAEEDRLKALERSRMEGEKRNEKAREAAQEQLRQLQEHHQRQQREREEEVAEGARIKRAAADAARECAEEEAQRKARMKSYGQEYLRANAEQMALKAARQAQDAKEDETIAMYAAEKERLAHLRQEHERTKFFVKQQRFEQMLRKQYEHLSDLKEREAARTAKHMAELEKAREARVEADSHKAAALKEQIRQSRQAQLARKAREQARLAAEEEVMAREWDRRNAQMAEAERAEAHAAKAQAAALAATLRQQMVAKEQQARAEVDREHDETLSMAQAQAREEAVFDAYCAQQMETLQLQGKSTVPLQLVLHNDRIRNAKPSLFAMRKFR